MNWESEMVGVANEEDFRALSGKIFGNTASCAVCMYEDEIRFLPVSHGLDNLTGVENTHWGVPIAIVSICLQIIVIWPANGFMLA
ncbi:MAG: hypothetical protein KJT03_09410 [Verrucomicrobiae bacterium]|nr:hypothetical protein [Verrucomicrobiae bacterium]